MHLESGFWMAANWPQMEKKTKKSQFADMRTLPIFFDFDVFPLSSLVTGPSFMSIS